MELTITVGLLCTLLGAALGLLTYRAAAKKADVEEGKENGTILTELGYIKSGVDDLKTDMKEQRRVNTELVTRLTAVEASAKQAHKRIDAIERGHTT